MSQLVIRSGAERDIADAFAWYEQHRSGLGMRFVESVDAAFAEIAKHPQRYRVVHAGLRRILLRRFPYAVFYRDAEAGPIVVAVLHCARNPGMLDAR